MQILLLKTQLLKTLLFLHTKWQSESYVQFCPNSTNFCSFPFPQRTSKDTATTERGGALNLLPNTPSGCLSRGPRHPPSPSLAGGHSIRDNTLNLTLGLCFQGQQVVDHMRHCGHQEDLLSHQRCRQSSWCFKSEWKKHEDAFEGPALCSFLKGRRPSLTVTSSLPLCVFSWPHPVKSVPSGKARRPLLSYSATTQDLPSTHTR